MDGRTTHFRIPTTRPINNGVFIIQIEQPILKIPDFENHNKFDNGSSIMNLNNIINHDDFMGN